jgi:hypothetical protein
LSRRTVVHTTNRRAQLQSRRSPNHQLRFANATGSRPPSQMLR